MLYFGKGKTPVNFMGYYDGGVLWTQLALLHVALLYLTWASAHLLHPSSTDTSMVPLVSLAFRVHG